MRWQVSWHRRQDEKGQVRSNWSIVERNWRLFLPIVRESWEALSERDLILVDGDRDLLAAMISRRYDIPREIADPRLTLFERGPVQ